MARSPSHRFGQIIGDALEAAIEPLLQQFATEHDLYLDKRGPRPVRRGSKLSWTDLNNNRHDLDYVLERGASPSEVGVPVAFIETAWRRYTKHSRNKAQEIQGAILPLRATYSDSGPFVGAVLAGVFTGGALTQLKSLGFTVLFFPYDVVVQAFKQVGIDAHFTEATPDAEVATKVRAWNRLVPAQRARVGKALLELEHHAVAEFMESLRRAVTRQIDFIRILPLHGSAVEWRSIQDAVQFIERYEEQEPGPKPLARSEINLRYESGEDITGRCPDKPAAIEFLRRFQLPPPTVPD